jgi:hypothetical protein
MKKIFIILILLVSFFESYSQEIKGGFIFIPQATSVGKLDFNKIEVSTPLLSNIVFITPKTYHNFCYVWGANAFVLVNGFVYHPEGKRDFYLVTSKNLGKSGGNIMLAWETELLNGNTQVWLAIEAGTSWETWDKLVVNLSLTIPFQTTIWKKTN